MKTEDSNLEYIKAKNKVEKLKRFYTHLTVFLVVNTVITTVKVMHNIDNGETFSDAVLNLSTLMTWMIWGMVIAIHAFSVFGMPLILGDDWEERKIEKFMAEELKNDKNI